MGTSAAKYEPLELSPIEAQGPHRSGVWSASPVSSGHFPSSFSQHKALLIGAITAVACYTLLALLGGSGRVERDHFLQSQIAYPSKARDLYKKPGTLQFDRNEYRPAWRRARYIPLEHFDELVKTGRNGLERDYHLGDGFDLLESIHAYLKNHASSSGTTIPPAQFGYLRNKTIIVLGDGNDRNALDYACKDLLSGTREIRKFTQLPIDLNKISDKERRDPHVCMLPGFLQGTQIWSFMMYSVLATEDTFAVPLEEVKPRRYLARLEQIANALKSANIVPDMVVVHSTLWDLDAINFEDAFINLPPTEALSIARMDAYRSKLREALLKIDEYFPDARKLYRTLQSTKVDRGDWWMQYMPPGTQPFPRVPYSMNKGQQMNTITSQVLVEIGWPIFDFHRVLSGYIEDYEGSVYFGNIGKTVWIQMILYYMQAEYV